FPVENSSCVHTAQDTTPEVGCPALPQTRTGIAVASIRRACAVRVAPGLSLNHNCPTDAPGGRGRPRTPSTTRRTKDVDHGTGEPGRGHHPTGSDSGAGPRVRRPDPAGGGVAEVAGRGGVPADRHLPAAARVQAVGGDPGLQRGAVAGRTRPPGAGGADPEGT